MTGVCTAIRTTPRPLPGADKTSLTSLRNPLMWIRMVSPMLNGRQIAWRRLRGFTFVELMVVIVIIVILITMAIPIYSNTIRRSKESVLKNNLFTLRTVIDNYTYDKQKAPQSLQDLVSEGYLREIPIDPMTGSNNWRTIMEQAGQSVNQSEPG